MPQYDAHTKFSERLSVDGGDMAGLAVSRRDDAVVVERAAVVERGSSVNNMLELWLVNIILVMVFHECRDEEATAEARSNT